MASIGSLVADLKLESAAFTRDLTKAQRNITSNTAKMQKDLRKVRKSADEVKRSFAGIRNAAGALAGALAVRQFARFATAALETNDALAKMTRTIGLSASEFQRWRIEAQLAGVEVTQVERGMGAFVKRIGELRAGTGALATMLSKTNVALQDQLLAATSTEQAMQIMLQAVRDAPTSFDKAALSAAAFSRTAGIAMVNLSSSMGQLDDDMVQLITRSDEILAASEFLNDQLTLMQEAFSAGFDSSIVQGLSGQIEATAESMAEARRIGEEFGRSIGVAMRIIAQAAMWAAQNIQTLATIIAGLIAMKAAGFFVGAAAAIYKFAASLLAAGKAGAILSLIMKRSVIGAVASVLIATVAATAAWEAFGEEAVSTIDAMNSAITAHVSELEDLDSATGDVVVSAQEYLNTVRLQANLANALAEAYGKSTEAGEAEAFQQEIYNELMSAGITLTGELTSEIVQQIVARKKAEAAVEGYIEAEQDAQRAMEESRAEMKRQAEEAREAFIRPFNNAADAIQSEFSAMFENILSGGVNSFADMAAAVKRIMIRLASEVATLLIFRPAVGGIMSSVGLPGIGNQLVGSPGGGASGGLGSLGGGGIPMPPTSLFTSGGGLGSAIDSFGTTLGFAGRSTSLLASSGSLGGIGGMGGAGPMTAAANASGLAGTATLSGVLGGVGAGFGTGMFVNSLLGGNQTGGMVGSGLGSAAGAVIGSIVPGIGTVIGGMIGGALGGALGGLFGGGGGVGPNAAARVTGSKIGLEGGGQMFQVGGTGADNGGNLGAVVAEAQRAVTSLNGIMKALDLTIARNVSDALGPNSNFIGTGKGVGGFRSAESLVNAFLRAGGFKSDNANLDKVIRGSTAKTLEENISLLSQIPGLLGPVTTAFDQATKAVEGNFDKIAEKAKKFGLDTAKVEEQRLRAMDELRLRFQLPFINDASNIVDFLNNQSLSSNSTLSPSDRLAESRRQYQGLLTRVQGGESGLGGALSTAAGNLLSFGRSQFASSSGFAEIEKSVRGDLLDVAEDITSEEFFSGQIEATRQQTEVISEGQGETADLLDTLIKEVRTLRREMAA